MSDVLSIEQELAQLGGIHWKVERVQVDGGRWLIFCTIRNDAGALFEGRAATPAEAIRRAHDAWLAWVDANKED